MLVKIKKIALKRFFRDSRKKETKNHQPPTQHCVGNYVFGIPMLTELKISSRLATHGNVPVTKPLVIWYFFGPLIRALGKNTDYHGLQKVYKNVYRALLRVLS
jgi:hypothetical protein